MSSVCMGVHQAMALIGNAKQATGEGKVVESGLTGLVATAMLDHTLLCAWC